LENINALKIQYHLPIAIKRAKMSLSCSAVGKRKVLHIHSFGPRQSFCSNASLLFVWAPHVFLFQQHQRSNSMVISDEDEDSSDEDEELQHKKAPLWR
jgi:hypothetical protein